MQTVTCWVQPPVCAVIELSSVLSGVKHISPIVYVIKCVVATTVEGY